MKRRCLDINPFEQIILQDVPLVYQLCPNCDKHNTLTLIGTNKSCKITCGYCGKHWFYRLVPSI